jgi:hypothetical protein
MIMIDDFLSQIVDKKDDFKLFKRQFRNSKF